MNIYLPIGVFFATSLALYFISSDPDKNKKPLNFIIPGLVVAILVVLFLKYRPVQEQLMEGNYFD